MVVASTTENHHPVILAVMIATYRDTSLGVDGLKLRCYFKWSEAIGSVGLADRVWQDERALNEDKPQRVGARRPDTVASLNQSFRGLLRYVWSPHYNTDNGVCDENNYHHYSRCHLLQQ